MESHNKCHFFACWLKHKKEPSQPTTTSPIGWLIVAPVNSRECLLTPMNVSIDVACEKRIAEEGNKTAWDTAPWTWGQEGTQCLIWVRNSSRQEEPWSLVRRQKGFFTFSCVWFIASQFLGSGLSVFWLPGVYLFFSLLSQMSLLATENHVVHLYQPHHFTKMT